ncbi:MAG: T9SS type A sorting domain-containing protein [Candidatus Poribacteria bacterium]|nr:T9SS type A sorting domain-containing protein [Candidatus Poribacteria bacterium]
MKYHRSVIIALILFSILYPSTGLSEAITREMVFSVNGEIEVPLDVPAGTAFNLTIDDISFEVDLSISAGDRIAFQTNVSSRSGTIEHGPDSVTLHPGEYTIRERYSGRLSSRDPLLGVPLAVLQSVEISRRLSVTHTTDYTVGIRAQLQDLRPHVAEGPLTISGDFPDIIDRNIPLTLEVTEPLRAGDKVRFRIDFRMKIVSDTRVKASALPRLFVEVIPEGLDQVVARVKVADVTNLFGFQFDLHFNSKLLKVTRLDEGSFLKRGDADTFWRAPEIKNKTRRLNGVLGTRLTPGGVSGDGTLATVTFEVRKPGTSTLELNGVKLLNEAGHQIDAVIEPGNVNTNLPVSATLRVVPQIVDAFVVAEVQIHDAVNVKRFSVDLVFPRGLQPVGVNKKRLRGTVIREITEPSTFRFQIYDGGNLDFVLQNGKLTGESGRTEVPVMEPGSITVVASPAWDINRDYKVNLFDIAALGKSFGKSISEDARPNPDVNRDGIVDIVDFVQIGLHFGEEYSPVPGAPAAPAIALETWVPQRVDATQLSTLQQMMREVTRHPLANTPAFMRSRELLAKLLSAASEVPAQTRLLPNFPNPFNPETWMPYQLADDATVKISIYNADGRLIRSLMSGNQLKGSYLTRDKAAYWNGRNDTGELVTSGLYFYHLTAGDFTATKRMVILK